MPIALAVGAGGDCLDIFSLLYLFSGLSPSLRDGPIYTEILSQRDVKPKTTNQIATKFQGKQICIFQFCLSFQSGPILIPILDVVWLLWV